MCILVDSLLLHHDSTGNVCNQTGKVNELQANIDAVKREVDLLRNASKLLLSHYMLPHIQSMDDNCAVFFFYKSFALMQGYPNRW